MDGANDYINAGQQNRGITNTITVEAWIKTTNFSYTWIVGKYSNSLGEDGGYHLYIIDGKVGFNGRDGSGNYRASGLSQTIVADNNWHHVAGVCNNGRWEVWVDGIQESFLNSGFSATNLTTQQAYLTIGNYDDYNTNYFKGNIDEVRIWKTARTAEQLRTNMCRKLQTSDANLVAYFKFDEINTTTFKDFSLSNNSGQLVNSVGNKATITSGAPIGDESLAIYQNTWSALKLSLGNNSSNDIFSINNIAQYTKGIHLYRVNNLPNSLSGISGSTPPNFYFGVFTVSPGKSSTYTVQYKTELELTDKCLALYGREDNAQTQWNLLGTTKEPDKLIKENENYRGEYIFDSSDLVPVTISGKAEICSGGSTILQANASGVSKFLWNTGETASSIQVNTAGTYSVKAFTTDQCFTEASIVVRAIEPSPIAISGESTICPGSTVNLQASGSGFIKFMWNTGATTNNIQVSSPGTYSIKAFTTDQCFTEASIVVKLVQPASVTITGESKICAGSSTVLQANANGVSKFLWNTGESTPAIQVSKAGIYSVKAFTTDQCYAEASIQIELLNKTDAEIVKASGLSICPNNSATLVASGSSGTYQWYDAATGGNLIFEGASFTTSLLTKTTTFFVQSTRNNQCSLGERTPVTVQVGVINADAGRDTTIKEGNAVILQGKGGVKYHWEPATGLSNANVERPIASPSKTTTYQVTAYSPDGCSSTDEVTITVIPRIMVVNTFSPNHDDRNDQWEILNIENYPEAAVEIFNRWGGLIFKSTDGYKKPWDGTYKGQDLPLATYYYIIRLNKKSKPIAGSVTLIR
ncbi:Ig-like domain-containing protein [Adhaeribacter arboris]|uniref:Ig-like domain-containing protein n=1 Tax=Adhaeribacter arboris TaxID=2072846 RepID=UPI00130492B0|nr:gliding motility-associated C-terminal domain-containing protein [Adhaeribacter arboris]